jgi:hypothetical protein
MISGPRSSKKSQSVDAFLGRTHECARSRGRRKSTRRASQHGLVYPPGGAGLTALDRKNAENLDLLLREGPHREQCA